MLCHMQEQPAASCPSIRLAALRLCLCSADLAAARGWRLRMPVAVCSAGADAEGGSSGGASSRLAVVQWLYCHRRGAGKVLLSEAVRQSLSQSAWMGRRR